MNKLAIFLVLVFATVASQYFFDRVRPKRPEVPISLLPASAVRLVDLGLHSAAAGLMWVETIQNIFAPGTKHYLVLPDYIKSINDTDPKFSYPYAFGTLVLPDLKLIDEGIEIGERGLKEADSDWRIPYYLATTYHIFKKDRASAVKYFNVVAQMSNTPGAVKRIAISYGTDPDVRQQTKQIWISIYETSNDEVVQGRASLYITHYELIELLEKAAKMYKQKFNVYPLNLNDLVAVKIIKEVPNSPFGLEYVIDSRGRINLKVE